MYTNVSDLPFAIQSALSSLGYKCKDIQVNVKESESLFGAGGAGIRCFATLVNLTTGESKVMKGSWGGANPWNPDNQVDLNDQRYTIPDNGVVIKGYEGGTTGTVRASITISPKNVVKGLLPEKVELSEGELLVLSYFGYKSTYKNQLLKGKEVIVEKMIQEGYIKKNKGGATTLTLKGKNAAENVRRW